MTPRPEATPQPAIEVAEIAQDDSGEVREAWETLGFWPHAGEDREWFEQALARNPGLFLAARLNGRIIGTVCGAWDGLRGWVYRFGVLPEFRGQGIGRALLREVEQRLRSQGVRQINLMVYEDNAAAMEYYCRRGYERSPVKTFRKRFGDLGGTSE